MLLTVVALVAVFGLASDSFLDPNNIINILRSIAIVTVIAIGVSISLTVGGFDLSVGSTASLANALVISLRHHGEQHAPPVEKVENLLTARRRRSH